MAKKSTSVEVQSASKAVIEDLKPNCPSAWRWIDNPRNVDVPNRVTIVVAQDGFAPLPEAPRAAYKANLTLTIISPYKDPAVAEDRLNEAGHLIAAALDQSPIAVWEEATRVVFEDLPAYDFKLNVPFVIATESEDNTTPTEE